MPLEPELRITLRDGVTHEQQETVWTYYNRNQKIIIDGGGAVVSGLKNGHPAVGFYLSYRPDVGAGTTPQNPAPANMEVTNLTIRGYESGGIEISPQMVDGAANREDAGIVAFVGGAIIKGNHFEELGSLHTAQGQANFSTYRFGVGGVMARGLENSFIQDNWFTNLENGTVKGTEWGPILIHAVYLRDKSSNNTVTGNHFTSVSGDPVRVNNASNGNIVRNNTLKNSGVRCLVSEFYNPTAGEADSTGTQIGGNTLGSLYGKKKKAVKFYESVSQGARPATNR